MTQNQTQFVTAIPGVRDMRAHQGLVQQQGADENKPLKATLTATENNYAILKLEGTEELIKWPKAKIPAAAKIGDTLLLEAVSLSKLKEEELSRMRQLLEDLIN